MGRRKRRWPIFAALLAGITASAGLLLVASGEPRRLPPPYHLWIEKTADFPQVIGEKDPMPVQLVVKKRDPEAMLSPNFLAT